MATRPPVMAGRLYVPATDQCQPGSDSKTFRYSEQEGRRHSLTARRTSRIDMNNPQTMTKRDSV